MEKIEEKFNDNEKNEADIYDLFCHYNSLYFDDALGSCILSWSSDRSVNSCTGTCHYDPGGGCEILLSEPVLKFCSIIDLKNALLHEMIHAFLWIKHKNEDHSYHGSSFQEIRNSINSSSVKDHQRPCGGYNIHLHHEFKKEACTHELKKEIKTYRFHHWKCNTCGDLIKKRREPSARDCINKVGPDKSCGNLSCHWHNHRNACSGSYNIADHPGHKEEKTGLKDLQHEKLEELPCMSRQTERLSETTATKTESDGKMDSEGDKELQKDDLSPIQKLCRTEGTEGKSDGKKAEKVADFSPVKDAKRNLGKNASSSDHSQKKLSFEDSNTIIIKTRNSSMASERSKRVNRPATPRKQKYTSKKRKRERKWATEDTVGIEWFCMYGDKDEDETIEPLKNKRTERKKRLKLLQSAQKNATETDDEMEG